jgi:regulation of enolase protein 1 (concanavalin A-like superfamily)
LDKSNNETGFKIERALNGGAFAQIFVAAANATTYTDTGLAAGTYTYRVRATNGAGDSAYTNVSTGVTLAAATVPTAPSNLVATAASTSSITLKWSDNSSTETGYKIERSLNGGAFAQIFLTAANATTYSDTGLAAGTYSYRVRGTNAVGDSAYSNTSSTATLPAAPTTLALSVVSSSSIKLTWVDNATNETGYKIERSTDGTTFTQLSTIAAANSTTFTDTGLAAGTKYFYRVRATNAGGDSAYSNAPNATTTASTGIPTPWVQADVGTVGKAGSATYASPTFTILGAGGDIWDKQDAFHYVYQPLTGDGTIIARVATEQNTNAFAKAGVMIRETLAVGSRSVTVDLTPGKLVEFLRRATAGSTTTGTSNDVAAGAVWVKLARVGNVFTASRSTNGTTWTTVGSQTITMASSVFIGLIVCSHTTTALNTSTFDNVSVSGGVAAQTALAAAKPAGTLFNSTTKVTSDIASVLI